MSQKEHAIVTMEKVNLEKSCNCYKECRWPEFARSEEDRETQCHQCSRLKRTDLFSCGVELKTPEDCPKGCTLCGGQ